MSKPSSHKFWWLFLVVALSAAMVGLMSCGSSSTTTSSTQPATGTVSTSLSDPPACAAPFGQYSNVYVTVTRVRAHQSSTASDTDSGWIDLVNLQSNPKQFDLFSLASTSCILTKLGSTGGLPAGQYQQIRFYLLDNTATGVTITSTAAGAQNPCGSNNSTGPFNCVVTNTSPPQTATLQLSSEAQTGIKIPPGQIAGGHFTIQAGQATDLNIDFNACSSIVQQGNGQYRLKPVLHAGEVSLNNNALSGMVVDGSNSNAPIAGAIVLLEQPDPNNTGIDRVMASKTTGTDGGFIFCPLPAGNYDVVVAGSTTNAQLITTTYSSVVAFTVPLGTNLGNIVMHPEVTPPAASPAAILAGQVTTDAVAIAEVSPMQQLTPSGGSPIQVTIPVFGSPAPPQPPTLSTATGGLNCPSGLACGDYSLQVPALSPWVGTFASGSVSFQQVSTAVPYNVNGHSDTCTTDGTITGLSVTAGQTTTAASPVALTGCH